jgi:hypothetical protein
MRQSWDFAAEQYLAAPERVEQGRTESFPAYQVRVTGILRDWLGKANPHDGPCLSADDKSSLSVVDLICSMGGNRKLRIMFRQLPNDPVLLTLQAPFAERRWHSTDLPVSATNDDIKPGWKGYTQPILKILLSGLQLSPEETVEWLGPMIFYRFRGEMSTLTQIVDKWGRSRQGFDWPRFFRFVDTILSPKYFQPDTPMPQSANDGLPHTQLGTLALVLASSTVTSHAQAYVAEGLMDWLEAHPDFLLLPIPMDNRRLAAECRVLDKTFPMGGAILADLLWPVLAEVQGTITFEDDEQEARSSLRNQRFLKMVYDNGGVLLDSLEGLFARGSRVVEQIEHWLAREGAEFSLCERHREHQVRQSLRLEEGTRSPEPYL